MSDLHRAVEAEIAAFAPDRVPAYDDLAGRARARRSRALAASAGLAAVAVAGVVAGSAALPGAQDRLSPADRAAEPSLLPPKGPAPYRQQYWLRGPALDDPAREADVRACLSLAGTSDIATQLPAGGGAVGVVLTGLPEAEAFEACVRRIEGVALTTTDGPVVGGLLGDPDPTDPASREAFLPAPAAGTVVPDARAEGRLEGDPRTGCLWLSVPGGARLRILLMHDTAVADFSRKPFVIRDGDRVLASEGDVVVLGGGTDPGNDSRRFGPCPVDGPRFVGSL